MIFALLFGMVGQAHAALIQINIGGFSGSETVVDYGLIQTFDPIDGETIGGVLHNFTVAGSPSNDAVIDGGPGVTNNISPANVEGDSAGVLSLTFASAQNRMGFGWATSGNSSTVTVELFNALNASLGSVSVAGVPDPGFFGGFFGVQSSDLFTRAEISFDVAGRFAADNLRFENAALPEPASLALMMLGAVGLAIRRRHER